MNNQQFFLTDSLKMATTRRSSTAMQLTSTKRFEKVLLKKFYEKVFIENIRSH